MPDRHSFNIASMQTVITAGAPLQTDVKLETIDFFFNANLCEFYGATETGTITYILHNQHVSKEASVGRPLWGMQVVIIDKDGNEVPRGGAGEVYIGGDLLMKEYYKNPEANQKSFRGKFFTLGDIGRMDEDGFLYLIDRKKDMIISGGENVFPVDIEKALSEHKKVKDVAVIGIPDKEWGEAVLAIVVPADATLLTADNMVRKQLATELKEFCKTRLASFQRPKVYEFVEAIPYNPSGKILKKELREKYWGDLKQRVF